MKVVNERLGHANATITLGVYAPVMPGMQRQAATKFAAMVYGAETERGVSVEYHERRNVRMTHHLQDL